MNTIAGIDVAKHELVIFLNGSFYTVSNDNKSIKNWFKKHKAILEKVDLFAFEPTGGYEKKLATFLHENNYPANMIHANHIRAYAKSIGYLAKTDKIDAKIIAEFAVVRSLGATPLISENAELIALMNRREQYIEQIKQEKSRLETLDVKLIIRDIKSHITLLENRQTSIENAIKKYIADSNELNNIIEIICSIPGVGFITAVSIICYLPEIFVCEEKQLSALAGIAPMNQDSGKSIKKRRIQGGRAQIRRSLYMSALCARRFNEPINLFYTRLRDKGKPYKVAMVAAMRKLLLMIRAVCIRGTKWEEKMC